MMILTNTHSIRPALQELHDSKSVNQYPIKMKKLILGLSLLLFAGAAMGQGFAKQQSESIATYLGLNPGQKAKVLQVYKKEVDKSARKHQEVAAKRPPKATLDARKKAQTAKSKRKAPKASPRRVDPAKGKAPSNRILHISFNEAQKTPGMQNELKAIFTAAQYSKWMELAGN